MKNAEATPNASSAGQATSEPSVSSGDKVHPLIAEVQCFLGQRDELAQKLTEEIEATEKKLAELKNTRASLFPESATNGQVDRKAKKQKGKGSSREAKLESSSSADRSSADSTV